MSREMHDPTGRIQQDRECLKVVASCSVRSTLRNGCAENEMQWLSDQDSSGGNARSDCTVR